MKPSLDQPLPNPKPRFPFWSLLPVALAFAFNLHALAADSFWGDEIFTASFASRTLPEILRWTANDIHPPLYYLMAGTFTHLTIPLGSTTAPSPVSDWLWRFPSVMAVTLTVAVVYKIAIYMLRFTIYDPSTWLRTGLRFTIPKSSRQASNSPISPSPTSPSPTSHPANLPISPSPHLPPSHPATLPIHNSQFTTALLLALSPIAIKYGQEARMHALFMCLSALATLLLFRALARPQQWSRWLAFALATTANIYTMYFGFLILAAQTGLIGFAILDFGFWMCDPSTWLRTGLRFTNLRSLIAPRSVQSPNLPISQPPPSQSPPSQSPLSQPPNLPISQSPNLPTSQPSNLPTFQSSTLPPFRFTAAVLLAGLLYLPWWPVLFNILRKRAAVGAIEGGVGSPLTFVTGVVQALGPMPTPVAWGFLGLFIAGLIFLARRQWPLAVFAALWLALPVALPIFLGDPRALQFRYAFILPLYLTVIASALTNLSAFMATLITDRRPTQSNDPQSPTSQSPNLPTSQSPNLPIPQSPNLPISQPSNLPTFQPSNLPLYLTWLLATLSFIAALGIYQQSKPDWRGAAAYLDERARPVDIILAGPLWDEGRFIDYYYRGQAQLLTPAALVANIQGYAASLRANGGRVWAINRFAPAESPAAKNVAFSGLVISEPTLPIYEPELLSAAAIDLAGQAVAAAHPWAAEAEAQGVLDPDPRTAQAAALRALGDTLVAAGRPQEALIPYQTAVDIFPGWVNGFISLAETHEAVGNLPAAAKAYQQAVAFNLEWRGLRAEEAAHLVETGQWAAAIEKYHQIID